MPAVAPGLAFLPPDPNLDTPKSPIEIDTPLFRAKVKLDLISGRSRMRGIIATALAAATLYFAPASAGHAQDLIRNGSFENPALRAGSAATFCTPACKGQKDLPGWSVVGVTGANIDVITKVNFHGLHFDPAVGKQYADLSSSGTLSGIEQAVDTKPGTKYLLKFFVGAIYDNNKRQFFGPVSKVDVYVNRKLFLSSINLATPADTTQVWKQCVAIFNAASAKTFIAFFAGTPPTIGPGGFDSIDGVTLEPAPAGAEAAPSCM
jgi:Protein of unknown function (DUF642)